MAQDWLADVRNYVADADENVVAKIVRYCGIALRTVDSSLVAFSDAKETGRVRQNYLKKKLGLTQDDATLDAAIAAVGERMKADRTKNRVTVYYLLAEHFDRLDLFGGAKGAGGAAAGGALAGGAMGLAAMTQAAGEAAEPVAASVADGPSAAPVSASTEPVALKAAPAGGGLRGDDDYVAWGCGAAVVLIGAIILAALLAWAADRPAAEAVAVPAAVAVPVAPAPVAPAAPVAPDGAGVIAGERDAKPMLTVYFDTGKADVIADFAAAAAPVLAYLEANPGATLAISGYNDATGNAAANAELSKNRAQNVQAAIVALGVAEARARLEKPAEATSTGLSNAEARRVEVVIVG